MHSLAPVVWWYCPLVKFSFRSYVCSRVVVVLFSCGALILFSSCAGAGLVSGSNVVLVLLSCGDVMLFS